MRRGWQRPENKRSPQRLRGHRDALEGIMSDAIAFSLCSLCSLSLCGESAFDSSTIDYGVAAAALASATASPAMGEEGEGQPRSVMVSRITLLGT